MAVTITPKSLGALPQLRDGDTLPFTTGEDPTYIEVDNLPVQILVKTETGNSQSFEVAIQSTSDIRQTALEVALPLSGSVDVITQPWSIIVKPKVSTPIIDQTTSPPRVELTGADLTNCEIAAFRFDVL